MSLLPATHPGFFEALAQRRTYTTLLYLLLSMATGILAFTYTVTGLSLSLGLAILIVGIPVAITFLMGARLLSVAEVHLLRALVGGEGPTSPALFPAGEGWFGRLKGLLGDRRTWTSLLYLLLGGTWIITHPNLAGVLCGLAGLAILPLTFHLALLLGRFQVWLAKHLLVQA